MIILLLYSIFSLLIDKTSVKNEIIFFKNLRWEIELTSLLGDRLHIWSGSWGSKGFGSSIVIL